MSPLKSRPLQASQDRHAVPLLLAAVVLLAGCTGGGEVTPPISQPRVGSISGQVSDAFGRPVANVAVTVSGTRPLTTSTDEQGGFQFSMLPEGFYSLSFSREGFEDAQQTVQAQANWDIHIQVQLVAAAPQVGSISGLISDPFGTPLTGVTVTASGAGQDFSDTGGQFLFLSLPTGNYSLSFSLDGFESHSESVQVKSGRTTQLQVQLAPQSLPSAGVRGVRITSNSGARLEFEVDVVVLNPDGTPLGGLGGEAFSIPDSATLHVERQGFSSQAGADQGPYSAVLLMDQSGSIVSTDPTDSRIQAGKVFFQALSAPDNAQLAAFASGGLLPYDVTVWGSFTSLGSSFYRPLDDLANLESGGTPLYAATASLIDHVTSNGTNPNRAVVVFTDGEDTDGTWSLKDVISLAQTRHVKLFTVGLSNSINVQVLSQMAAQTQGAMLWAWDARQLISIYGSLGNLLRGAAQFYRIRWSVTRSSGSWLPGTWISGNIGIQTPMGLQAAPFYLEVPGSGLLPEHAPRQPDGTPCATGPVETSPVLCLPQ